jgi:hypothetical protein
MKSKIPMLLLILAVAAGGIYYFATPLANPGP